MQSWNSTSSIFFGRPARSRYAGDAQRTYLIYDVERRAGYVGSACGQDNIIGRWRAYAETGHGGNKELRDSDPANLRFSILERTSPDLSGEDIVALEGSWKKRLHTREFGLNRN